MFFIGDVHGKTEEYYDILGGLPEKSKSLQVGDMGIGFPDVALPPLGRPLYSPQHLFIRGNHDNPAECAHHPRYAGNYGVDRDEGLFFLGGAPSIDAKWRTEGVSWWRDEELSLPELQQAVELYVQTKPEIVATHEAPESIAYQILTQTRILLGEWGGHRPCRTDYKVREKGPDYFHFKEQTGFLRSRTSQVLEQMRVFHKPKIWVFGHYHMGFDKVYEGTRFVCLPELKVMELSL